MRKQWKQWEPLFLGAPKITADGDCTHEIKRCFLLGRKAMTNLDSILKSRDIGEGNGNPLQYSCLENPLDKGASCPWGHKELDMTERLHSLNGPLVFPTLFNLSLNLAIRSTSRLYIVTLLIQIISRVHHEKRWAGISTSWNQDCQEKYQ